MRQATEDRTNSCYGSPTKDQGHRMTKEWKKGWKSHKQRTTQGSSPSVTTTVMNELCYTGEDTVDQFVYQCQRQISTIHF